MENKSNESDSLKKEIENKNIVVKNLVNYYPKQYLIYIGSKNHTFYFGCRNQKIVIQQQFSLNRQSKIIKQWRVDFWRIAFMNKSHEIIVLGDYQIEIWEIDTCYNLIKSTQLINHLECLNESDETQNSAYGDSYSFDQLLFQLQLSTMDDWFVASDDRGKILFFQKGKGMEGEWELINTMKICFETFLLNELGNILIILLYKKIVIYIKNNFGEWRIAKQMDGYEFCFIANEQFVVLRNNIITIWQVKPEKFDFVQLQQLKFDFKNGVELYELYGINYMKQTQLLIVQTRFAIYFIKKKNEKFYFAQCIEIHQEMLVIGSEGLLFNIYFAIIRPERFEILKILEN